jgi:hypothetical protein
VKTIIHLLISFVAALVAFVGTSLIVVGVQLAIHGNEAFEHDAGADFAVTILCFLFAAPVALACFAIAFHRLRFKRWLPLGLSKA